MLDKGSPHERLKVIDPDLALDVETRLNAAMAPIEPGDLETLVSDTLWALSQEIAFGKAVAIGYAELLAKIDRKSFAVFRAAVRKAGRQGPTIGKLFAIHLVPVFLSGDRELLKLISHVLNKTCFAATGGSFQHDWQLFLERCPKNSNLISQR